MTDSNSENPLVLEVASTEPLKAVAVARGWTSTSATTPQSSNSHRALSGRNCCITKSCASGSTAIRKAKPANHFQP